MLTTKSLNDRIMRRQSKHQSNLWTASAAWSIPERWPPRCWSTMSGWPTWTREKDFLEVPCYQLSLTWFPFNFELNWIVTDERSVKTKAGVGSTNSLNIQFGSETKGCNIKIKREFLVLSPINTRVGERRTEGLLLFHSLNVWNI